MEYAAEVVSDHTGPWVARSLPVDDRRMDRTVPLSRAFNLVLSRPIDSAAALAVRPTASSNPMTFLRPMGDRTFVGTVHAPWDAERGVPDRAPPELVNEFLADLGGALPGFDPSAADVVGQLVGLIPAASPGSEAGRTPPEGRTWVDPEAFDDWRKRDSRAARTLSLDEAAPGHLLLAEVESENAFRTLDEGGVELPDGWRREPTNEEAAIHLVDPTGRPIVLAGGAQVMSAEGLEFLALLVASRPESGRPLAELIDWGAAWRAVMVVPWALGKWMGHRGRVVARRRRIRSVPRRQRQPTHRGAFQATSGAGGPSSPDWPGFGSVCVRRGSASSTSRSTLEQNSGGMIDRLPPRTKRRISVGTLPALRSI